MGGWTAGRTQTRHDPGFFVRGGSRPDGQNTGSAHGTNTHARTRARARARTHARTHPHTHTHTHIHTYARIDRRMRQTDGHTCTCIDGKLKDNLF